MKLHQLLIAVAVFALLIGMIVVLCMSSGCMVIYAPGMQQLYAHTQNQNGTNNNIREDIPIEPLKNLTGAKVTGIEASATANISGNNVASGNTGIALTKPTVNASNNVVTVKK